MIPKNINEEHVLQALDDIDTNGIKYPLTKSKKYDLLFNNKTYPPKLTISLANQFANEEYLSHLKFNTNEAQSYLKNLSPNFIIQKNEIDPILDLVNKYKEHVRENKLEGEIYKWRLLGEFKGRPDVNAVDFYAEIKGINYFNLIYPVGLTVIHTLAKERPEPYRACFKVLLDESKDLDYRLKYFTEETLKIYREIEPNEKFSHHQDERTMATFLTYFNPDKYTFYKDSFYQKYCKLLGVESKKKGEKYLHYLELIDDFINEYINDDSELLKLIDDLMLPEYFQDSYHKVLAQDILYQILDMLSQSDEVVALMASDATGWQDDHIDETEKFDASIIWNSKRPSGTNESLKFLRNIIDEGNSFNLYYCYGGNVHYRATVIDFAESQEEMDRKDWQKSYNKIYEYRNTFAEYKDKNKSASIVFLVKSLEKINPIPVKQFKFHKRYDVPRQDNLSPVIFEPEIVELEEIDFVNNNSNKMGTKYFPLNQILFGPPGTGKTYNTINKSLKIIGADIDGKSRDEIKSLFDTKMKDGQIVFTTFHQSMSYEDFIEGIKPVEPKVEGQAVNYKIVDGIFKRACAIAAHNSYKLYSKSKTQSGKYSFDDLYEAFTESIQEQIDKQTPPVYKSLRGKDVEVKEINSNDSIIARAKNSVAKGSAPLTKENLQKLYDKFKTIDEIEDLKQVQETVQVTPRITEFYAVFSGLKEFEKSYKPDEELIIESGEIASLDFEEIQKKFNAGVYNEAIKNFGTKAEPVVLIIDEINRGNVSQIFGELITLVEEDKRLGKEEALEAVLPYSKKNFGVPPNLYIIGTMNTADRSVEALDAALRRRFSFEEIRPDSTLVYENLVKLYANKFLEMFNVGWEEEPWVTFEKKYTGLILDSSIYDGITDVEIQDIIYHDNKNIYNELIDLFREYKLGFIPEAILEKINQRIEKLLDKDHQIGHSYFMSLGSLDDLKLAFQHKIIPLLQEYFFGDYGKIGLVLGEGFFEPVINNQSADFFAKFYDYSGEEFEEKPIYKFRDIVKLSNDDFTKAINLLLLK